jgi:hypothetical protein
MTKLLKAQLRKRATYETTLRDTVLNPKDKIDLPDREATILTKTQQLTRYDEVGFLDLETDNENIQKQTLQQANLAEAAENNPDSSIAEQTALAPGPHDDGHDFKPKGKGGGKGGEAASTRIRGKKPDSKLAAAPSSSSSSSGPSGLGPKATKATAATQTTTAGPEQFNATIDDDMDDAFDETEKVLEEHKQAKFEINFKLHSKFRIT